MQFQVLYSAIQFLIRARAGESQNSGGARIEVNPEPLDFFFYIFFSESYKC